MGILEDLQSEVELFFDDLNWTYIIMYVVVLYGIKHKEEFYWYNQIFDDSRLKYFKVWIAGIIIMLFFSFFRWKSDEVFDSEYISQLLRSWIIVMIFNTSLQNKLTKIDK